MKIIAKGWVFCVLLLFATAAWGGEMAPSGEPGVAEGTGITFQLDGFAAAPVTLDTANAVRIFATSDPGNISIYMEAAAGQTLTAVALSGLQPMTTYYTYVDHLYLQEPVVTDEAGSFTANLDLTNPITFIVKTKPSTIFLSADPWVDGNGVSHPAGWSHSNGTDLNDSLGTWDAVTRTATLLADPTELIEIRGNSITLDGNGHSCMYQAGGPTAGIYANTISNLTIRNLSFTYGTTIKLVRTYSGVFEGLNFTNSGIQLDGQNNVLDNSNFTNSWTSYYPFSYYNTIKNSVFTSGGFWCYGLTSSNEFIDNQFLGGSIAISLYNSDYNTFSGNHIENYVNGVVLGGSGTNALSEFNKVYNNNFVNIGTPVSITPLSRGNQFNLPAPDGGNYFSAWTGPDDNFDGFVDLPYLIYSPSTTLIAQDNLPYTTPYGWIDNQAPVFVPVGPQEVLAYNTLTFPVSATDPDGDNVVSVYAGELPAGAFFDSATGTFQWQPNGSQTGVYVVRFFAVDDGIPSQTEQLEVVITVGQAESPADLTASMVEEIATQDFPTEVEASYTANIGKVDELLEHSNVTAVINQYEVLLHKIDQDLKAGKITQEEADLLIMMANDGINLLN